MANSTLVAAIVFLFLAFTIREWLMILAHHPFFIGGCVLLLAVYGFNSGGIIREIFRVIGIILVTMATCCFLAALVSVKED